MRFKSLIALFASVSHIVSAAAQQCYYPNRNEAKTDVPCDLASADRGGSACCAPNDTCLSNGLCFSQTGLLSRRTCTDQSWQNNGCAQYCQNSLNGVGQVIVLAQYAPGASTFCCGPGYNVTSETCASDPATPFTIHLGMIINNRTSGSISPNTTSDSQNPPSPVTTTGITTITASVSANSSSNRDTAIGAGVGVPLGVALLTALGFLWRERRHTQRLRREVEVLNVARDPSPSALALASTSASATATAKHQLDDALLEELDGRQVNEMAERRYE